MGGAVSAPSAVVHEAVGLAGIREVTLRKLPDAIEEAVYVHEKFPLIIDTTEQASRFLKYQTGAFIRYDDPVHSAKTSMNRALVNALLHGRSLTLKFASLEVVDEKDVFQEGLFPRDVISRSRFFLDEVWHRVIQSNLGDPNPNEISISPEFLFIICTTTEYIPATLMEEMYVFKVVDQPNSDVQSTKANSLTSGDSHMDEIASLYGAHEIIRVSLQLVEAAFDGDLDGVKDYIQKGYHLESFDGRKHTALSEAASQGHMHIVQFLLDNGADPNSLNDTNRSALWRASFNGHLEVVKVLLEAGASPEFRDKVSMESAFDVAQNDEVRKLLHEWDLDRTIELMEERKRIMMENLEARIKTTAERELFARNMIRKELVSKAEHGDAEGVKEMLLMIAEEAEKADSKPRASAEVRSDTGQSLLSIAAQNDYEDLAVLLLTHWKLCDEGRWDVKEGEMSVEAKVFKGNPNSRDLKGWTCVCIAVFHDSRKVLKLLLEHGGDPNIRSSYNKNAWDLAKDELDAAEKVIKSKAEIRQVLIDYDQSAFSSTGATKKIFGNGKIVSIQGGNVYEDLPDEGSPVVMNIEMNAETSAVSASAVTAEKAKGSAAAGSGTGIGKGKAAAVGGKKSGAVHKKKTTKK